MCIFSTVAPDVTNIDNKLQVDRVDLQTSTVDISFPVSKVDAYTYEWRELLHAIALNFCRPLLSP